MFELNDSDSQLAAYTLYYIVRFVSIYTCVSDVICTCNRCISRLFWVHHRFVSSIQEDIAPSFGLTKNLWKEEELHSLHAELVNNLATEEAFLTTLHVFMMDLAMGNMVLSLVVLFLLLP